MKIQNQLRLIPIAEIKYNRTTRQRTNLTSASVFDLACGIALHGLFQNVGVSIEEMEIEFGERRLTAFKLLHKAIAQPIKRLLDIGLSEEQAKKLQALATQHSQYEAWTKIPARLIKGSSLLERSAIEFIENVSREDLPWQDKAQAAYTIHKEALARLTIRNKERNEDTPIERWTDQQTAELLGITRSYFTQLTAPLRELESASEKTKAKVESALKESSTPKSALNASRIIKTRHGERITTGDPMKRLVGGLSNKKEETKAEAQPESEEEEKQSPIIQADFHEWAKTYSGSPFNFIHCDFPYGLDFNTSQGMKTNAANKQVGIYDDSEQVYWDLINTLIEHSDKLIAPSAHVMFWYSQAKPKNKPYRLSDRTRQMLGGSLDVVIQDFDMIWHCSDNLGTIPDSQRYGRRTYETAMLLTFGDRKIVKPKALSVSAPRGQRVHRSQKPVPVLSHFFEMFVDESTRMADFTCGSGTSLIAAKKLKAASVLGIEHDAETVELAEELWAKTI